MITFMNKLFDFFYLSSKRFITFQVFFALVILLIGQPATKAANLLESETIIAYFEEKQSNTRNLQDNVTVTIFANGYIKVYRPSYYKRSGTFSGYLDQVTLNQLWEKLTSPSLLYFNETKVQQQLKTARNQQKMTASTSQSVSDAPTTILKIYPNRYMPSADFDQGNWDAMKPITWHALYWTAENFPELEVLQNLIEIREQFEKILDRSDFEPVK